LAKARATELFRLMLGILGDNKKSFLNTLNWAFEQAAKIQTYPALAFSPEMTTKFTPKLKTTLRTSVQVFPLLIFPNTPIEREAKRIKAKWDKNPPYMITSTKYFPKEDMEYCFDLIKTLEKFTKLVFGESLIQISVQGRLI